MELCKTLKECDKRNLESLYKYFTCSTIRHKVKHPLFLLLKFSEVIKVYYNTDIIDNIKSNEDLMINIENNIFINFKNRS